MWIARLMALMHLSTNIMGTHTLLKVAKKFWLDAGVVNHHFHHVSTDEVYGSLEADAPHLLNQLPLRPIRLTLPLKRLLIIWCAPIITPMA